jgi:hypothetical protein
MDFKSRPFANSLALNTKINLRSADLISYKAFSGMYTLESIRPFLHKNLAFKKQTL